MGVPTKTAINIANLNALLTKKGITRYRLIQMTGIRKATLYEIFSKGYASEYNILLIAQALDCSIAYLQGIPDEQGFEESQDGIYKAFLKGNSQALLFAFLERTPLTNPHDPSDVRTFSINDYRVRNNIDELYDSSLAALADTFYQLGMFGKDR